jgi:hypothetical protein
MPRCNVAPRVLAAVAVLSALLLVPGPVGAAGATDLRSSATVPTNNPRIFSFPAPPAGFDPLTASPNDLQRYGLPLPPDATRYPRAHQHWQELMRHAKRSVTPHFTPQPGIKHNVNNLAWSGGVVTAPHKICGFSPPTIWGRIIPCPPAPSQQMLAVQGEWPVPNVYGSAFKGDLATWVGLDGPDELQVQQIGTAGDLLPAPCGVYYAWVELFPDPSQCIDDFPTLPGDDMFADVEYSPTDNTLYFYLLDATQNQFAAFNLAATHGSPGLTAEWILERTGPNGNFGALPSFGSVTLTNLWFYNAQGGWFPANNNPFSPTLWNMVSSANTLLDTAAVAPDPDNAAITITWQGYQ